MRRASAVLVALAVVLTGVLVPVGAEAAEAPRFVVQRSDPLMTDSVVLEVAALGADGSALAFRGTAVLSTGKATSSVAVSAAAGEEASVAVPTTALRPGWATLRLRATVAGRTVTRTLDHFAEIPASLSVSGFGCASVGATGGTIRWAVDRLDGAPVRTPNSRDVPLLPYVRSSAARWSMTGPDGLPLATSGRLVVRAGAKVVARQALPKQVRRLVFGTKVRGAFRPGALVATLTLTDAAGRTVTAEQAVVALRAGTAPCTG